jgi:hypothetical protein
MEPNSDNHKINAFAQYIEKNFNVLKQKMKNKAQKDKLIFDEDVFMNTIVKCLTVFPNNNATKTDIENYFWKAFKQNIFSNISRDKFRNSIDIDEFDDDVIDEEYNEDIDEIIDTIKNEIIKEFGPQIYDAWLLHVCNNYTYTELEKNGYKGLNLHNEFRQIKRFIDNKLLKGDTKLKRLLKENDLM